MKKILLFITIINCGIIQSQNVNIPDPTFKEKLLNHSNPVIDTNSDNEIQFSEAEAITGTINTTSNPNLSDITGIEAFINITGFSCAETKVTKIDLSSNTKLTSLDFNDCEVSNLEISNCTELKELWCFGNNLTSLNIENNKKLEFIFCYDNQLTDLNIDNNIELKTLSAFNNKISDINITNNINLEVFAINQNLISSIDISNSQKLNVLVCRDNPNLLSINLKNGNNQNFTLSGEPFNGFFENLPKLTSICVDDFNNTTFKNEISNQVSRSITFTDNCSTLSNEEFSIENYTISPNPTENILTIKSKKEIFKIEIYNYIGKLILEKKQERRISISNFKNGIYLLKIFGENGVIETKKILKK